MVVLAVEFLARAAVVAGQGGEQPGDFAGRRVDLHGGEAARAKSRRRGLAIGSPAGALARSVKARNCAT